MPLVYVHGVNTRRGDTPEEQQVFDHRLALTREQFRNVAFSERTTAEDGLRVFTPYWGDLGVKFARNLASLPQAGIEALSVGQPEAARLLEVTAASVDGDVLADPQFRTAPLLTLARTRSLGAAVDLLIAGAANAPLPPLSGDTFKEALPDAARFSAAAERYGGANPRPAWLSEVTNDGELLARLVTEVTAHAAAAAPPVASGGVQSLSVGSTLGSWLDNGLSAIQGAVSSVADQATQFATGVAVGTAREIFMRTLGFIRPAGSAFIGTFLGDVFTYMDNRAEIRTRVLHEVNQAVAAKRPGDNELYLLGHSFGGIILHDILTSGPPESRPVCDLYVTVGSQVALFAEMGRLADKENIAAAFAKGASAVVPRPAGAKRWLNVFDRTDFIGFGTKGVFAGARDFEFETDALPLVSHAAYLDTPRFYGRLRERVAEAFATGTDS